MSSSRLFIVALAGLLLISVAAVNPHQEWQNFKQLYGKQYVTKMEEAIRFNNFLINKEKIDEHNRLAQQGIYNFNLGINQFADQLHDEFLTTMNLDQRIIKKSNDGNRIISAFQPNANNDTDAVDWREQGCVRPAFYLDVLNATWPFVSTGAMEGQWCANHRTFLALSEQNLLDCIKTAGIPTPDDAYTYCVENGGVDTEDSYPLTGETSEDCKYVGAQKGVLCNGVIDIPSGNETLLEQAVLQGPVSVVIDASQPSFQLYINGVYQDGLCSPEILDHRLLVVGFNVTEDGQQYWIARNSWGINWGVDGYIWIARNSNNMCGIATDANFPRTAFCSNTDSNCNQEF